MRSGWVAFALVFAAGLAALLVLGATRKSDLVYSTGAQPSVPVAVLRTGDRACQGPYMIPSGAAFDRIAFAATTYGRPGAPIRVEVAEAGSGRELASGRLAGGYPDFADAPEHIVRIGRVQTSEPLEICFLGERRPRVGLLGQPAFASPHTTMTVNDQPTPNALAVTLRTRERSLLALAPQMAERAARFRAGWISPALYAVLAVLLLVGAPLLLARGIARAAAQDRA